MVRVTLALEAVTTLPLLSSTFTTGWVAHGTPRAPPPGWVVKTTLLGAPTVTGLVVTVVNAVVAAATVRALPVLARLLPATVATLARAVTGLVVHVRAPP